MNARLATRTRASPVPRPRGPAPDARRQPTAAARLAVRRTDEIGERVFAASAASAVRDAVESPGSRSIVACATDSSRASASTSVGSGSMPTRGRRARRARSARRPTRAARTSVSRRVASRRQCADGAALLAHELAHVAQQGVREGPALRVVPTTSQVDDAREHEADRAARGVRRDDARPAGVEPGTVQRKVAMRDVGRGEQSGFARVPELIARLNGASTGLTFAVTGSDLTYAAKPGGTLSNFDTQMQGFIDRGDVLPLRFTYRHGLLGDRKSGFHDSVVEDAWSSGYVDIDDLLASSDLGMQTVLVHFLRERADTKNYAKRIGSPSLDTDPATPGAAAHEAEFDRAHAHGIVAELQVLQDFFADPTIRIVPGAGQGEIFRVFRNARRDTIRTRVRPGRGKTAGVDAVTIEVVTRDGKVHTPDEYKALIAAAAPTKPGPTTAAAAH